MRYLVLFFALICTPAFASNAKWTPPKDPNPQTILDEAVADTKAKRYETALAKHVWFYEKSLSLQPSLYGVRLSFALSYWMELANAYPPALVKLKALRDQAQTNVMAGTNIRHSFHDMESINDHLGELSATRKVFETLDEKSPETAKEVFKIAQPSLLKAKAYALIYKYISPDKDFAEMREMYRRQKKMANSPRLGKRFLDFVNKKYANDTTILVGILAVNDRKEKAEQIAAAARTEWDDSSFHEGLDKALEGVVPDPWP